MLFRVPIILALADCAAVFCYAAGISPMIGQSIALAVKLGMFPLLVKPSSLAIRQSEAFIIFGSLCGLSMVFGEDIVLEDTVAPIAFFAHLFLSMMIARHQLGEYLRATSYILGAMALYYIVLLAVGQIPTVWGRYFYFHGLHPNLGAEIAAAGAMCAVISLKYRHYMIVSVFVLVNAVVMEGRSAIIAIVCMAGVRTLLETLQGKDRSVAELKLIAAIPFATALVMAVLPWLASALLLDDRYRGLGTGFVGRTDQWEIAIDAFKDRPITGQGLGWFVRTQDLGAHNFILYGFAEMGLLALVLYAMMGWMAVKAFRIHGWKVVSLTPMLVLLIFNDRFINLNPYPFLIWFLLFALSTRPQTQEAAATARYADTPYVLRLRA